MGSTSADNCRVTLPQEAAFAAPRQPKPAPLVIRSRRALALRALLIAIAFFLLEAGMQRLIYTQHLDSYLPGLTGALSALCVGFLSFGVFDNIRKRRLANKKRFEAIGEANHHIRNALHAIQFRLYVMKVDSEDAKVLAQSVERIRWVLEEVLPNSNR